ncbi:MAG: FG-GAP repeat protein [Planctomycetes bacterium]|nr:FG-GAP repeat protein [Planctomycetota bacterium]
MLVGSPLEGNRQGAARLYSGFDGSLMHQWNGVPFVQGVFGAAVSGAGDVNGDGILDIAIGAPVETPSLALQTGQGRVYVYSGADYSELFNLWGDILHGMGSQVSPLGDLNGDGFDDLAVTARHANFGGPNTGSVYILSMAGTRTYATQGGGIQTLQLDWSPGSGSDPAQGTVHCSGASPLAFGVYGVSFEAGQSTVSGFPVFIDLNPALLFLSVPFFFDATGSYTAPSNIRHPFVGGITVRAQFFELSATPAASNGLELRLVR